MTTLTATGNGVALSNILGATIMPRSLADGHTTWVLWLRNDDKAYIANTNVSDTPQRVIVITINSVEAIRGYPDGLVHIYGGLNPKRPPQAAGACKLLARLSGRDYSQDLANRVYTSSFPAATEADNIIRSALAITVPDEITIASDWTTPQVGPYDPRDESRLAIAREMCERANYDAYVNSSKALQFFAIGASSSGIVLSATDVLEATYVEFDRTGLRNSFDIYGDEIGILPTDEDSWTNPALDAQYTDPSYNSTNVTPPDWYVICTYTIAAAALLYGQPFRLQFEYQISDAAHTADYKVEYKIGSEAEVLIDQQLAWNNIGWLAPAGSGYDIGDEVGADLDPAADYNKDVIVKVSMRVSNAVAYARIRNWKLYYQRQAAYWKIDAGVLSASGDGLLGGSAYLPRVKGSYALYHYNAGVLSSTLECIFDATPLDCKYKEHNYNAIDLIEYTNYSAGEEDYIEVRVKTGADPDNNYFWKRMGLNADAWDEFSLTLGVNQNWTEQGSPDWTLVKRVSFTYKIKSGTANFTEYMDKFRFTGKPVHDSDSDATSITAYRQRDYVEKLPSATESETDKRAASLKEKNKDPIAPLQVIVPGTEVIVGGAWKCLPGLTLQLDCADLNISSGAADNYRIIDATVECWPYVDLHSGRDFIAILNLIPKVGADWAKIEGGRFREVVEPGPSSFQRVK